MEITSDQITQYLDSRDDFDLELFAYRTMRELGWQADLGGAYIDSSSQKHRQYDVRGRTQFSHGRDLRIAVECKSLGPEFPLVVSRIPRPGGDTSHDVLKRWRRPEIGDTVFAVEHSVENHPHLYPAGEMVGKAATQIRWAENQKRLIASDSESFDKWSKALESASEVVETAAADAAESSSPILTFVMPVLLVNDGTLWVVDYEDDGRRSAPKAVDETLLFVDREHRVRNRTAQESFRLSHLHIYTRSGFTTMLMTFANPASLVLEKTFGFALRKSLS